MLKGILIIVGMISVGLGFVGIFIPVLPTTPFLLLAAACFMHSSQRLHYWLLNNRWFGSYIRHYHEHHAMTLRAKVVALSSLWGVMLISALCFVSLWWVRIIMLIIAIGVTTHLLRLKTLTTEDEVFGKV